MLYDVIDQSNGFYSGHAATGCRSIMNVVFKLPSEELDARFLELAAQNGMTGRDFKRGKQMFSAAACYACHRFGNAGGMTGPDLTG